MIKLVATGESEIHIKDIDEQVIKQLFEISKGSKELSQPKKRKSDQIADYHDDDSDENEVIYMEQYIHKNEFEMNKLREMNIKIENEVVELKQMYREKKSENISLKEEITHIKLSNGKMYELYLELDVKFKNYQRKDVILNLNEQRDKCIPTSSNGNVIVNVEMESYAENGEIDWFDKDPNSFAASSKTPIKKGTVKQSINKEDKTNNNLNDKNNKKSYNLNTKVANEQFKPQQQKQNKFNNNNYGYGYYRERNGYGNYQDRNSYGYNQCYYRDNQRNHSSKNKSYVYKKDNQIIIGSQNRNLDNNVASNKHKNRTANECKIYLGNVSFGTRFDIIEKMLNNMGIQYNNLSQLKNNHRYFQSYYFEIPRDKVSNVFDSKNWEQGLIVREFR